MLYFMNMNKFVKNMKPVTSTEFFTRTGEFNPAGLYSEIIFGPEKSKERLTTFSYIDLNVNVIHPSALKLILQLNRKINKFLTTEAAFIINKNGELVEDDNGVTGIQKFIEVFPKIKFKGGSDKRDKYIWKLKDAYETDTLFTRYIPVFPPEQRPIFKDERNEWRFDPINNYYIDILKKSFHISSSMTEGPLFDLLNYEIQRSVIEHDEHIRTLIQKKSGIIRSQLLGKRTDFSGRAVITPGPELKLGEIGVPFKMAVGLFEPFIIHKILKTKLIDQQLLDTEIQKFLKIGFSIDSIKTIIKMIQNGDIISDNLKTIFIEATLAAMEGRVVLAKRDPALRPESVRGYKPVLVFSDTIQLHPLIVGGHNADFDGDAMALFHPLTNESQQAVKEKMMRQQGFENMQNVNFAFTKEMCVGLYSLTKDVKSTKSPIEILDSELELITDPYIPVIYRKYKTTSGKALYNSCFPNDYPFYEGVVDKKVINSQIPKIVEKYGQDVAANVFTKLEKISFKFATIMSPTITLDEINIPEEIIQLKEKLKSASLDEADKLLKKMMVILQKHLQETGLGDLVSSGSTKGWSQPFQILVAKGIVADPEGNILDPIKGSFADGLTNKEYFMASMGARKGIADRVLNTANTGYLARQLAYILNSVEVDRHIIDCKTKRGLIIRINNEIIKKIDGRYIINKAGKVELFNKNSYKEGDTITLKSPVFCETRKICHTCYGKLIEKIKTPYVGIAAAQLLGESASQNMMKTFHTGGAIEIISRDILYDLIQNDPYVKVDSFSEYLKQNKNILITNKKCKLSISFDDYEKGEFLIGDESIEDYTLQTDYVIKEDEKIIWFTRGIIGKLEFDDIMIHLILDYPVRVKLNNYELTKNSVIMEYDSNEEILDVPLEAGILTQQVQYLKRVLGGKEIFKDVHHLFMKLFNIYSKISPVDLVHMEVLLCQCLRDKTRPELPARLGKTWDPILMNIKQIVFSTSFLQSLAFEDINQAIRVGMISEDIDEKSILEKILTGELVEERKRK